MVSIALACPQQQHHQHRYASITRTPADHGCAHAVMVLVAEVGGRVLGALTYPHLIIQYSACYGRLASHYMVLPYTSTLAIPWWCNKGHLKILVLPIYRKMVNGPVLIVLNMGVSIQSRPIRIFKIIWACLQAPIEDLKMRW